MTPDRFIEIRKSDWERLTALIEKTTLTSAEVEEVGALYRATTSDLSVAQRDFPRSEITNYLNQLTAKAHSTVYRAEPFSAKQFRRFFTHDIPRTFRETWRFTVVASLLFYLPAILIGIAVNINPTFAEQILPAGAQGIIAQIEDGYKWFEFESYSATSALITTNNIGVSIRAFAGGMLAGFFTIYVLIFNGILLGGILGLAIYHDFFALLHFVIGHGVIELSMICVAGGAGLVLGWAILHPRPYSRSQAIALAGRKALIMLITCALWLVVAGLIEGFISPRPDIPPYIKYIVGIGSGIIMYSYLFLTGRNTHD